MSDSCMNGTRRLNVCMLKVVSFRANHMEFIFVVQFLCFCSILSQLQSCGLPWQQQYYSLCLSLFPFSSVSLWLFLFHSISQLTEAGSEMCRGEKVAWWAQPGTAGLSSCIGKRRGRRAGSDLGRCVSCVFGMATDTPRPLFTTASVN